MQGIKIFFWLILLIFCIIGCKTYKEPAKTTGKEIITRTIKEVQRDTIVKIEADSSFYQAYIECRDGKPKIINNPNIGRELKTKAGKNLKPPSVQLSDKGTLNIKCEELERQLKVALKEKQVLEEKSKETTIIPQPKIIKEKIPLTFWEELWIRLGKLLAIISLIYIGLKLPWRRFVKLF
ncbi:MAG: hypothetical protein ACTTJM_03080 [Bergeyella cardium]|nr:MAG TPA: hypothetical protein [Caudoviricetes sp.]